jgi:hypothetical protein
MPRLPHEDTVIRVTTLLFAAELLLLGTAHVLNRLINRRHRGRIPA